MKILSFSSSGSIRLDFTAGLTTAIVSLPMALAFGLASGAGAQAGLYGAVLVGFFAACFGSSTRLISEPTGPMTLMFATVLSGLVAANPEQGVAMAFTVVMVAGLVQLLLGALKLGHFITLMPYSVISGFMSGIGVLLILLQLPGFLGQASPGGGAVGILMALPFLLENWQPLETLLAAVSLGLLFCWPAKWSRRVPAALVAVGVAVLLARWLPGGEVLRRIGRVPAGLPQLQLPTFTMAQLSQILLNGFVLGLLGSVDALLTAMIADSLTREEHDSNRELMGQGVANLVSGLLGGLPGAGATMGTVVNIQAGSRGRRSGMIRAGLLVLPLLGAGPLLQHIPLAVLSAITLKVGVDILDWSFMKKIHRVSGSSTFMMWTVLLLTVFVDVILAVGVGVFVANLLTIKRLSDLQSRNVRRLSGGDAERVLSARERELLNQAGESLHFFYLNGPMIFGVAKAISREHAALRSARGLVIDLTEVPLLGVTVGLAIENLIADARGMGIPVWVAGGADKVRGRLQAICGPEPGALQFCENREAALEAAVAQRHSQAA